jgi:2-keto-3-deoxygluconate permease
MLVAAADAQYSEAATPATVLVAACVIVTAMLAPPLTAWWARRVNKGNVALPQSTNAEYPVGAD